MSQSSSIGKGETGVTDTGRRHCEPEKVAVMTTVAA